MSKHTPGPWFSGCHGRDWIQIVVDDESMLPLGTTSKLVAHVNTSMGEQQCVANAHLIAAAPAMYEALMSIVGLLDGRHAEIVSTALAQAEGRTL